MKEYETALQLIDVAGIDQIGIWENDFGVVAPVLAHWSNPSVFSSRYGLPFYQAYAFYANDDYYLTYFSMGRYALAIQIAAYGKALVVPDEKMDEFIKERVETFIDDNRSFEFRQHIACLKSMAEIFGYDPSDYVPFTMESIKLEKA